jgi:hypothetical protein
MNLSELQAARAAAGSRYSAAITELQAALIDLAALDQTLANRNVSNSNAVPPPINPAFWGDLGGEPTVLTFRKLPESLAELEHPVYAALLRDRLADKIAAARNTYINSFAP